MTDKQLIRLAINTLTTQEFDVWITKHYAHKGRQQGSLALNISQDAWRYRLDQAHRKMLTALARQENAA